MSEPFKLKLRPEARLANAAADMLEALKRVVAAYDAMLDCSPETMEAARAAIAKAQEKQT